MSPPLGARRGQRPQSGSFTPTRGEAQPVLKQPLNPAAAGPDATGVDADPERGPLVSLPDGAEVAAVRDAALRCMGDARVLGSLVRVEAEVGGSLACRGSAVGGSLVCAGSLRVRELGGPGTRLEAWVGAPPREARGLVDEGWRQDALLRRALQAAEGVDEPERERLEEKRRGIASRLARLADACGRGVLTVEEAMHPGVTLRVGLRPERYTFHRLVRGPLEVSAGGGGVAELRQGLERVELRGVGGGVRV